MSQDEHSFADCRLQWGISFFRRMKLWLPGAVCEAGCQWVLERRHKVDHCGTSDASNILGLHSLPNRLQDQVIINSAENQTFLLEYLRILLYFRVGCVRFLYLTKALLKTAIYIVHYLSVGTSLILSRSLI